MKKARLFTTVVSFLGDLIADKYDDADNKKALKKAFTEKFKNVCGKTGRYDVPNDLWQKRTPRKNRVLIPWKTVNNNNLTLEDLGLFEGDVVVEFVNNDYFDEHNFDNIVFNELKNKLGSDEKVSAIISIRSEGGSASSAIPREVHEKMVQQFPNYKDLLIRRKPGVKYSGCGNKVWEGFIYYCIRGGQQETILSHPQGSKKPQLFNPACEYASQAVSEDINLVLVYFALKSVTEEECKTEEQKDKLRRFRKEIEEHLKMTEYDGIENLFDYCAKHPCLVFGDGKLCDPIQMLPIEIMDFANKNREDDALDLTHDEAVNNDRFFVDQKQHVILGPARPTNLFWSKKLSNMMQQNFSLSEFFKHEEDIVNRRKIKMNNN